MLPAALKAAVSEAELVNPLELHFQLPWLRDSAAGRAAAGLETAAGSIAADRMVWAQMQLGGRGTGGADAGGSQPVPFSPAMSRSTRAVVSRVDGRESTCAVRGHRVRVVHVRRCRTRGARGGTTGRDCVAAYPTVALCHNASAADLKDARRRAPSRVGAVIAAGCYRNTRLPLCSNLMLSCAGLLSRRSATTACIQNEDRNVQLKHCTSL